MEHMEVLKGRSAEVAELVGCPRGPSSELLMCMQNVAADHIVNTTHKFLVWDLDPVSIWGPIVETHNSVDPFITEDPRDSVKPLTKPLLTGFNYAEGAFKTTSVTFGDVSQKFRQWNEQFYSLTPISLFYNGTDLDCPQVTEAIRKFYFGSVNEIITPDLLLPITEVYGDRWFIMGTLNNAERHRHNGPTFLYYYNYNKNVSLCPAILQTSPPLNVGACHLDELMNFFPMLGTAPQFDPSFNDPDFILSVKMVEMWTNFAKCSNPSTSEMTWETVKSDSLEHLEITNSGFAMKSNPIPERREFWKNLIPCH